MKRIHTFITIIAVCMVMMSCAPQTKEAYLIKYEDFVSDISSISTDFTEEDWMKADKKHKNYTDIWYEKFKDELTFEEKIQVIKYTASYNLTKGKNTGTTIINSLLSEEEKTDLEENLEEIGKDIEDLGESLGKTIEDILD